MSSTNPWDMNTVLEDTILNPNGSHSGIIVDDELFFPHDNGGLGLFNQPDQLVDMTNFGYPLNDMSAYLGANLEQPYSPIEWNAAGGELPPDTNASTASAWLYNGISPLHSVTCADPSSPADVLTFDGASQDPIIAPAHANQVVEESRVEQNQVAEEIQVEQNHAAQTEVEQPIPKTQEVLVTPEAEVTESASEADLDSLFNDPINQSPAGSPVSQNAVTGNEIPADDDHELVNLNVDANLNIDADHNVDANNNIALQDQTAAHNNLVTDYNTTPGANHNGLQENVNFYAGYAPAQMEVGGSALNSTLYQPVPVAANNPPAWTLTGDVDTEFAALASILQNDSTGTHDATNGSIPAQYTNMNHSKPASPINNPSTPIDADDAANQLVAKWSDNDDGVPAATQQNNQYQQHEPTQFHDLIPNEQAVATGERAASQHSDAQSNAASTPKNNEIPQVASRLSISPQRQNSTIDIGNSHKPSATPVVYKTPSPKHSLDSAKAGDIVGSGSKRFVLREVTPEDMVQQQHDVHEYTISKQTVQPQRTPEQNTQQRFIALENIAPQLVPQENVQNQLMQRQAMSQSNNLRQSPQGFPQQHQGIQQSPQGTHHQTYCMIQQPQGMRQQSQSAPQQPQGNYQRQNIQSTVSQQDFGNDVQQPANVRFSPTRQVPRPGMQQNNSFDGYNRAFDAQNSSMQQQPQVQHSTMPKQNGTMGLNQALHMQMGATKNQQSARLNMPAQQQAPSQFRSQPQMHNQVQGDTVTPASGTTNNQQAPGNKKTTKKVNTKKRGRKDDVEEPANDTAKKRARYGVVPNPVPAPGQPVVLPEYTPGPIAQLYSKDVPYAERKSKQDDYLHAQIHEGRRTVEELLALPFTTLQKHEKARLLLPLMKGMDPAAFERQELADDSDYGRRRQRLALQKAAAMTKQQAARTQATQNKQQTGNNLHQGLQRGGQQAGLGNNFQQTFQHVGQQMRNNIQQNNNQYGAIPQQYMGAQHSNMAMAQNQRGTRMGLPFPMNTPSYNMTPEQYARYLTQGPGN